MPAMKYTVMHMNDSHMMVILLVAASAFTLALVFTVFPQTLQKLHALTAAKQPKKPSEGSVPARAKTSAPAQVPDSDEDEEETSYRKVLTMIDKAKGRRANLLTRLKAISNDGE